MSNDTWATPDELYDPLHAEFEFDLCASKENTKCDLWSDDIKLYVECRDNILNNLIRQPATYWINPPYSAGNINVAMECVHKLNNLGKTIVSLTRFDPSTGWFQEHVDGVACEVRMLNRRPQFVGALTGYPFPCCVSIYRGYIPRKTEYYIWGWK